VESIPGDYQFNAINFGRPAQRFWHSAKLRLLDHLEVTHSTQIALDAGCGSGVVSHYLAGKCRKVVGIDASEEAIKFATTKFGSLTLSFMNLNLQAASSVGKFDLIVCFEVLEHLEPTEVQGVLDEFFSAANNGAKLCITVPNSRSLWPFIEWILDTFHLVPKLKNEQHLSHFNRKNLAEMIRTSGWKVDQIATFNGIAPFLAGISINFAKRVEQIEFYVGRLIPLNLIHCVAVKEM